MSATLREIYKKNEAMFMACEFVHAGKSVTIAVSDYDPARELFEGPTPFMRECIAAMNREWGRRHFQSEQIEFLVLDFAMHGSKAVLAQAVEEIGPLDEPWEFAEFSTKRPNTIVVVVGAEAEKNNNDMNFLVVLAKYAPVVFIYKQGTRLEKANLSFFQAVGEHAAANFNYGP